MTAASHHEAHDALRILLDALSAHAARLVFTLEYLNTPTDQRQQRARAFGVEASDLSELVLHDAHESLNAFRLSVEEAVGLLADWRRHHLAGQPEPLVTTREGRSP